MQVERRQPETNSTAGLARTQEEEHETAVFLVHMPMGLLSLSHVQPEHQSYHPPNGGLARRIHTRLTRSSHSTLDGVLTIDGQRC